MKSVLQKEKECFVCKKRQVHEHHIFMGTSNRKKSEQYGYKVFLCPHHHNMSDEGVHFNKPLDLSLKAMAQKHFEKNHGSRADFIKEFGKSWL